MNNLEKEIRNLNIPVAESWETFEKCVELDEDFLNRIESEQMDDCNLALDDYYYEFHSSRVKFYPILPNIFQKYHHRYVKTEFEEFVKFLLNPPKDSEITKEEFLEYPDDCPAPYSFCYVDNDVLNEESVVTFYVNDSFDFCWDRLIVLDMSNWNINQVKELQPGLNKDTFILKHNGKLLLVIVELERD